MTHAFRPSQNLLSWLASVEDHRLDFSSSSPAPSTRLAAAPSSNDRPHKRRRISHDWDSQPSVDDNDKPLPSPPASAACRPCRKEEYVVADHTSELLPSRLSPPPPIMASPRKRPLPAEDTDASVDPYLRGRMQPDDQTPRAPRSYASFAASDDWGATPSLTSRVSSLSSVTRKSSPTKQFRHAELWEDGFAVRKINQSHNKPADKIQPLPSSLRDLKARLNQVSLGVHLLPERCRDEFSNFSYPAEDASIPPSAYLPPEVEAEAEQQWRIPPLSLIKKTISKATDCDVRRKDEYAWNADVHHGLFAFVFDDEGLVDAETCPTADILSRFKAKGAPSKSIDFCIVVRPENLAEEVEEREKMERLCKYRFGNSINHSVQGNLCCCPIAVSIETKRPGGQWDDALLQMGTWQAAQWRSYTQHGLPPSPAIEFLPGIIVHGHQWRFVATVRQGSKAVLLTEIDIGTTSTEFGVIQIVIALEILKRWSAEVFWPAFKSDVVHHGLSVVGE